MLGFMVESLVPFLLGLLPIVIARTWQARIVAVCFGCVSLALAWYMVWAVQTIPDVLESFHHGIRAIVAAFVIAPVSLVVTYFVDRKYAAKA